MISNTRLVDFLDTCEHTFKRCVKNGKYGIQYIREREGKGSKIFFDAENVKKAQIVTMCERIGCSESVIDKITSQETEKQFELLYEEIEKKRIYLAKMSMYLEQIEVFGWDWYSELCVIDATNKNKTLDYIINNMADEITESVEIDDEISRDEIFDKTEENESNPVILDMRKLVSDLQPYIDMMRQHRPEDLNDEPEGVYFVEEVVEVFVEHVYSVLGMLSEMQRIVAIYTWLGDADSMFAKEINKQNGADASKMIADYINQYRAICECNLFHGFVKQMLEIADHDKPNSQSKEMQDWAKALVNSTYAFFGYTNSVKNDKIMKSFIDLHIDCYIKNAKSIDEVNKVKVVKSAVEYQFKQRKIRDKY